MTNDQNKDKTPVPPLQQLMTLEHTVKAAERRSNAAKQKLELRANELKEHHYELQCRINDGETFGNPFLEWLIAQTTPGAYFDFEKGQERIQEIHGNLIGTEIPVLRYTQNFRTRVIDSGGFSGINARYDEVALPAEVQFGICKGNGLDVKTVNDYDPLNPTNDKSFRRFARAWRMPGGDRGEYKVVAFIPVNPGYRMFASKGVLPERFNIAAINLELSDLSPREEETSLLYIGEEAIARSRMPERITGIKDCTIGDFMRYIKENRTS